jgi:hypothetical protein
MLRAFSALLLCLLLVTSPSLAYETELSDTAVREAYFLGQRNGDKTRAFFLPYTKHLPIPRKGPNISEIRLLTPLAQVVQISSQVTSGYSAQQAALDYKSRGDTILLVVHIEFTPSYGPIDAEHSANDVAGKKGLKLRTEDFWQEFRYGIKQKADWIEPRAIHGEADYGGPDSFGSSGLVGAWVYVEYDAHAVVSDDTDVSVFTTDDQEVQTTFDLAKLR